MLDPTIAIHTIRNAKKTLFVLCGLPYAGKSFIAQQILGQSDAIYISIDSIVMKRGFDWNTNKLPTSTQWREIFEESYEAVRDALELGKSVLYDSTNHTFASREALRVLATSAGADTCVIYVKVGADTVWKRWEDNQLSPSRSQISQELVQMTLDTFEEPTSTERTIVVPN